MSALVDFLLARVDEREDLARRAKAEVEPYTSDPAFTVEWIWAVDSKHESGGRGLSYIQSSHPDSPDDILADCEAKRRIISCAAMHLADHEPWIVSGKTHWGLNPWRATLRALAVPYSAHPDYDERWAL